MGKLLKDFRTRFGVQADLYVRLNSIEGINNHGQPAVALFRGFKSKADFDAGESYMEEWTVQFACDTSQAPGPLAYAALTAIDPGAKLEEQYASLSASRAALAERVAQVAQAEAALPKNETLPTEAVQEREAAHNEIAAVDATLLQLAPNIERAATVRDAFAKSEDILADPADAL